MHCLVVKGRFCFIGLSAQFTQMSSDVTSKSKEEDILTVSTDILAAQS